MSIRNTEHQSFKINIQNSTFTSFNNLKEESILTAQFNKKPKFTINPRLSILPSSIDPQKSKLQIYKQHLINIRVRKHAIPHVPQPSIISCFNLLKDQKDLILKKQKLKKQVQHKKTQYQKLKKMIDKYTQIYESKQQSMKQKILLSKILQTKLESQFQKTKQKFKDLQFCKIINLSNKKLYFYQLAEIFFNDKTRNIFSLEKQLSRTDQQMGICLGYLGFLIEKVAKIVGIQMWIKFKFKGSKSTITITDPKIVQNISGLSSQGNSSSIIIEQSFLLHPKQQRLSQALIYLSEQLKQIMKYYLGINIGKSNNFYQLCEQLSKYLLNV